MAFVFLEGYMASSSNDPTTGSPVFLDSDAPDPAVNPTEVAAFAASVGTRLIGSTAQRTAYTYARDGLCWFDTTLDREFRHNGSGWVQQPVTAFNVFSGITDAFGDVSVTHGMGLAPVSVVASIAVDTPLIGSLLTVNTLLVDATTFKARIHRQDTGAPFGTNAVKFYWVAVA